MKKVLGIVAVICTLGLTGCNGNTGVNDIAQPFKSYKIIEKDVVKSAEDIIMRNEAKKNGLDTEQSSAHVTQFTKIGDYASGTIRILGVYTDEGLKKVNKNSYSNVKSTVMNYDVTFEYSYKTQMYSWSSNYKY